MKVEPELKDSLKNLGFTEYYINLYVGLLSENGELNARELSEKTNVPYSRIYEILNEMVENQYISKIEGRPSTFIANPPKYVFQEISKKVQNNLNDNILKSMDHLNDMFHDGEIKEFNVRHFKGKLGISRIKHAIKAATLNLRLLCQDFERIYPAIEEELKFLYAKGVEVQIITKSDIENNSNMMNNIKILQKQSIRFKFVPQIQISFILSDDKEGCQVNYGDYDTFLSNQNTDPHCTIFSSDESTYVEYLTDIFENIWNLAEE